MSFLHNWPCQDCCQVINGLHSNLPGIEARRRADKLRAGGWQIDAMDPGCTWHGYWYMCRPSEWPVYHGAVTLEDLLHMVDTQPPDRWEDLKEAGMPRPSPARPVAIYVPPAPAPRVIQLSLF